MVGFALLAFQNILPHWWQGLDACAAAYEGCWPAPVQKASCPSYLGSRRCSAYGYL